MKAKSKTTIDRNTKRKKDYTNSKSKVVEVKRASANDLLKYNKQLASKEYTDLFLHVSEIDFISTLNDVVKLHNRDYKENSKRDIYETLFTFVERVSDIEQKDLKQFQSKLRKLIKSNCSKYKKISLMRKRKTENTNKSLKLKVEQQKKDKQILSEQNEKLKKEIELMKKKMKKK